MAFLVAMRVAGALVSSVLERQNLVLATVAGTKRWPPPAAGAEPARPVPTAALLER